MTSEARTLEIDDVRRIAAEAFIPTGSGGVGLEVEWLVHLRTDASAPVTVETVRAAVGDAPLPRGGSVSFEPGGQLELSTRRCDGPLAALDAAETDGAELRSRLERAGLQLVESGVDRHRPPRRSLHQPRYAAMEAAFDADGPSGRLMMCSTASLQINVDFGPDPWQTWHRLGAFAPVLAATFANSPVTAEGPSPFASARLHIWSQIDPTRTSPVPTGDQDDWADYVLDARVLLVRDRADATALTDGTTLRSWVEHGNDLGHPDADDVRYHLTTLFPPIRPRGWLELRMIDAIDATARRVAVAVVWALVHATDDADALVAGCAAVTRPWDTARFGLADPLVHRNAVAVFELASSWLREHEPVLSEDVDRWLATMVRPGRTPADLVPR